MCKSVLCYCDAVMSLSQLIKRKKINSKTMGEDKGMQETKLLLYKLLYTITSHAFIFEIIPSATFIKGLPQMNMNEKCHQQFEIVYTFHFSIQQYDKLLTKCVHIHRNFGKNFLN